MRYKCLLLAAVLIVAAGVARAAFGDVVSSFGFVDLHIGAGDALAWDGAYLWTCSQGPVYAYRLTTSGSLVSSFRLTGGNYGYFRGATFDGVYLWFADIDPNGLIYAKRFTMAGSYVSGFGVDAGAQGLAWDSGYIWVSSLKCTTTGSVVASYSPGPNTDIEKEGHYLWEGPREYTTSGSLVASFPLPGGVNMPGGTTFDGNYLWVINTFNECAYQVDIDVVAVGGSPFGRVKALYR